jgi:hypothetical protein
MEYMWANTSSMNLFPHEQGGSKWRVGNGDRLSRIRVLQSAQGRKTEGSVARRSFAGVMQSISHTGHFMMFDL